jgi:hypothetical protein
MAIVLVMDMARLVEHEGFERRLIMSFALTSCDRAMTFL